MRSAVSPARLSASLSSHLLAATQQLVNVGGRGKREDGVGGFTEAGWISDTQLYTVEGKMYKWEEDRGDSEAGRATSWRNEMKRKVQSGEREGEKTGSVEKDLCPSTHRFIHF